jgi:hypothetical protein
MVYLLLPRMTHDADKFSSCVTDPAHHLQQWIVYCLDFGRVGYDYTHAADVRHAYHILYNTLCHALATMTTSIHIPPKTYCLLGRLLSCGCHGRKPDISSYHGAGITSDMKLAI